MRAEEACAEGVLFDGESKGEHPRCVADKQAIDAPVEALRPVVGKEQQAGHARAARDAGSLVDYCEASLLRSESRLRPFEAAHDPSSRPGCLDCGRECRMQIDPGNPALAVGPERLGARAKLAGKAVCVVFAFELAGKLERIHGYREPYLCAARARTLGGFSATEIE